MAEARHGWFRGMPIQHPGAPHAHAALERPLDGLSPRQKREVAYLVAAGIASAVFFLVPALDKQRPVPSSAVIAQMAVDPAPPAGITPVRRDVRTRVAPPQVPAGGFPPVALVAAPVLSGVSDQKRRQEAFRNTPGAVMRVLVGDGRYRVQPFPMVIDTDRN